MKLIYLSHVTGFDRLLYDDNKEAETAGEEMLYAILNLENSDKCRFADLKKCIDNDYVLNTAEYTRTDTAV